MTNQTQAALNKRVLEVVSAYFGTDNPEAVKRDLVPLEDAIITALTEERDKLRGVLKLAEQFIENGVELGYVRMPDPDCKDSAHDMLPLINQALRGDYAQ